MEDQPGADGPGSTAHFEVLAHAVDSRRHLGSIEWGFHVDAHGRVILDDPGHIQRKTDGEPSPAFRAAGGVWNDARPGGRETTDIPGMTPDTGPHAATTGAALSAMPVARLMDRFSGSFIAHPVGHADHQNEVLWWRELVRRDPEIRVHIAACPVGDTPDRPNFMRVSVRDVALNDNGNPRNRVFSRHLFEIIGRMDTPARLPYLRIAVGQDNSSSQLNTMFLAGPRWTSDHTPQQGDGGWRVHAEIVPT